jgi:hypothetical protein
MLPGMEAPPHAMWLGDDEKDYYRGTGLPGWSEKGPDAQLTEPSEAAK